MDENAIKELVRDEPRMAPVMDMLYMQLVTGCRHSQRPQAK